MQNEEKTLETFMNNLAAQLGKQAFRIVELETVLALRTQELEELKTLQQGKNNKNA